MFQIAFEPSSAAPAARCRVAGCTARATHRPILCVTLLGSEHVSRVALPAPVCAGHRDAFSERFLTPARRADMEASLRSHGRGSPDWARTRVEFESA